VETLGKVISTLRQAGGYKYRSNFAKRIDVSNQYMADIENDVTIPAEDKLQKIADVLNLDESQTAYLFKLADRIPAALLEQVKQNYYEKAVNPLVNLGLHPSSTSSIEN